jgi:hypothetical protein
MFDGRRVVYSYCPDVTGEANGVQHTPRVGCDIFIIDVASKTRTQLTNGEYEPNTNPQINTANRLPVFNMGPTPVSGGRIAFTSNRHGFVPPKGSGMFTSQLFVMNEDGSDVHFVGALNIAGALHPFQLKDGRICWSTQESQGYRDSRGWGIWCSKPDGREWEPLQSAFGEQQLFHFATQLSNGDVIVEEYYNFNTFGFGSFITIPLSAGATSAASFGPADAASNPSHVVTDACGVRIDYRKPFSWLGSFSTTPFAHPFDRASGLRDPSLCGTAAEATAPRLGKVMHPQGAPGNDLLMAYTPGPATIQNRPTDLPRPQSGIYVAKNVTVIDHPDQLVRIVDEPNVNEIWPRALVPYRDIYGVQQPVEIPFLPNDGTLHPSLPPGTPYGIIGTSSMCNRESKTGNARNQNFARSGLHYDGLETMWNRGSDNWINQGSDARIFSCDDIDRVRIILTEPLSEVGSRDARFKVQWANERMRVLGEVSVRKPGVSDVDGNPDTSFSARIPADTPFTFQLLDRNGQLLTMAQTWHQVRPGEVRVNCGGCHAHSQRPTPWAASAAAKVAPVDLLMPAHDVEYRRHIEPMIQAKCVSCHRGDPATAPGQLAFTGDPAQNYLRLANDPNAQFGQKPPAGQLTWRMNTSRYVRPAMSTRSLLTWVLANRRLDGWTNERFPGPPQFGIAVDVWNRDMTDLDFEPGTVDHSRLVTDAERRMVSTWIDLFAPEDRGAFFADENRPALTVHAFGGQLIVGAADAYSGLDTPSLTVLANGASVSLRDLGDGRWSAQLPSGRVQVEARVRDRAGNTTVIRRTLSDGPAPSPAPGPLPPGPNPNPPVGGVPSPGGDPFPFDQQPVDDRFDRVRDWNPQTARATPGNRAGSALVCADSVTCFAVDVLHTGIAAPRRVQPLADGRILWIEGDASIRLMAQDGSVQEAYSPDRRDLGTIRISDMTVAPDFTETGRVYLAVVRPQPDGSSRTSIVRARELAGRFGELATIVPDFQTGSRADPALAVGGDGTIYLAMPAETGTPRGPFDGGVLAFAPDGRTINSGTWPVVSNGDALPSALLVQGGKLWLGTLRQSTLSPPVRAVAAAGKTDSAAAEGRWVMGAGGAISVPASQRLRLQGLDLTAVANGNAGEVYIAGSRAATGEGVLLRLRPLEASVRSSP